MYRVTFFHPDLGIGGAERLIVDAALASQKLGHEVRIITTHHDPEHCFAETKDGTLPVTVIGNWLPRHIFGKLFALCAYIRMIYAAIGLYFLGIQSDVIFCDLVSISIPFLRLTTKRIIYYCHHPDQLLTSPGGWLKQLYRIPINYLEEITTGRADEILVNSIYTSKVFKNTFKRLSIKPGILYPSIHTDYFDSTKNIPKLNEIVGMNLPNDSIILLSINRYERKKNLSLALDIIAELKSLLSNDDYRRTYLIMAGGYDKRIKENVDHHMELIEHTNKLEINDKVIFLRSPSDVEKIGLLNNCTALIYTPPNEHFGIVPLEAMYFSKPVIAHNSGGPMETIINNKTGYLVDELSAHAFAQCISLLINNEQLRKQFGEAGKKRIIDTFSFSAFRRKLNDHILAQMLIDNLIKTKKM